MARAPIYCTKDYRSNPKNQNAIAVSEEFMDAIVKDLIGPDGTKVKDILLSMIQHYEGNDMKPLFDDLRNRITVMETLMIHSESMAKEQLTKD